jgi:ribosomal protein L12E/L44/L45/RPP1/RPP2
VVQPIPPHAPVAAASSHAARRGGDRGKGPLRISTPDESEEEIAEEESDEDMNVYLNTAMFTTQMVRKC